MNNLRDAFTDEMKIILRSERKMVDLQLQDATTYSEREFSGD